MAVSSSSATRTASSDIATPGTDLQDALLDSAYQQAPVSGARPILRTPQSTLVRVGRYQFADCIAKGGMATVHFARLQGDFDFSRIVAVKRLLPQFATDEQFKAMFVEEARLAARIRHPNVVPTLDVVADGTELILVMDYVHGDALSSLLRTLRLKSESIVPLEITTAIISDVLRGLAFAHATTNTHGEPLNIVHCDVSPQNILVGADGVSRVLDFGIAKATTSLPESSSGVLRGKPGYVAPEQLNGAPATPQSDLFSVGVVLWEMLTGQRLFGGGLRASLSRRQEGDVQPPSAFNPQVPAALDAVVMKALDSEPSRRFVDATAMMRVLEFACPPARPSKVAEWVEELAAETLTERHQMLSRLETEKRLSVVPQANATAATEWLDPEDLRTDAIGEAKSLQTRVVATAPASRRLSRVAAGIAVVAMALLVGGYLAIEHRSEPAALSTPVGSSPHSDRSGISQNHPGESARASVGPSAGSSEAMASVTAPIASVPGETRPLATAQVPVKSPNSGQRTAPVRANQCSPPYTIDSAGRKHYRAECFR